MKFVERVLHLKGIKNYTYTFLINHILAGTKHFEKKRRLLNSLGHEIGENTKVVGPIYCTGKLIVGKDCWIGKNLNVNGNGTVSIGDNCDIAPEVTFQTGGHEFGDKTRRAGEGKLFNQNIGNGVWIGGRATFFGNVTVEDSCVISGCACVVKDVPADTLVGGVPAQVIRRLDG